GCLLQRSALARNQPQVAEIGDEARALADHEGPALDVDRICEGNKTAADAEIPEGDRHDAAAFHFAFQPLNDEACREQALSEEADQQPDVITRKPGESENEHDQISFVSTAPLKRC